ncbi:MAG: hypothetical protein IJJ00_04565 [Erysipelotrichaceae bacterium]|nr:hypothetical protein [Erysipelotrichaceae bacterium]
MTDKRKKACPNTSCHTYKQKKYDASLNFCPICGEKLIYVCKNPKCFKPIEDKGPYHTMCEECIAHREDIKDEIMNDAKKAGKAVLGIGPTIVAAIKSETVKEITKTTKKAVHNVFNKIKK